MSRRWFNWPAYVGAAVLVCAAGASWAQETEVEIRKPKPNPASADTKKGSASSSEQPAGDGKKDKPPVKKPPVDPYVAPEGNDTKVLRLFLSRLQRTPPKERTEAGILEHFQKIEKALDDLLTRELEDEMLEQVFSTKVQILGVYPQLGVEGAAEKRQELLAKAVEDERAPIAKIAKQFLKMERVQGIAELEDQERQALVEELAQDLQDGELGQDEIEFAMMAGSILASIGKNEEAVSAYNLFSKYLEANGDPNAKQVAESMQGTVRRLSLLGNSMEITGTKIDGTEFKLEELKGKVVLIDFWATWCGPCLAELPNVAEQYELYHDKGFEVVGISLDEDREALEEFLKEKQLPWIQLHQNDGSGWRNENATRYGIQGIPSCFLIDQEGKVVSLECRGEALPEFLAKLLGPVEKSDKSEKSDKADKTDREKTNSDE